MTALHILVSIFIGGYLGSCELRAPDPLRACEARWGLVTGYLLESPFSLLRSLETQRRRKRHARPRAQGSSTEG